MGYPAAFLEAQGHRYVWATVVKNERLPFPEWKPEYASNEELAKQWATLQPQGLLTLLPDETFPWPEGTALRLCLHQEHAPTDRVEERIQRWGEHGEVRQQYSLNNDPVSAQTGILPTSLKKLPAETIGAGLQVYYDICEGGRESRRMDGLRPGMRVLIGDFVDERVVFKGHMQIKAIPEGTQDLWMASTGTGLAPMRGLLFALIHCLEGTAKGILSDETIAHARRLVDGGLRILFLQGPRIGEQAFGRSQFEALAVAYPELFHYLPTITKPAVSDIQWDGHVGRMQTMIPRLLIGASDPWTPSIGNLPQDLIISPERPFYLMFCGNKPASRAVEAVFVEQLIANGSFESVKDDGGKKRAGRFLKGLSKKETW